MEKALHVPVEESFIGNHLLYNYLFSPPSNIFYESIDYPQFIFCIYQINYPQAVNCAL